MFIAGLCCCLGILGADPGGARGDPKVHGLLVPGRFLHIPGPNPVLLPGPAGAWDDGVIEAADALHDGPVYYFFYHGTGQGKGYQLGVATASAPLGPCRKHGGRPILDLGPPGSWDDRNVACAMVLRESHGCPGFGNGDRRSVPLPDCMPELLSVPSLAGNDGNPLRRHAGEQCLRTGAPASATATKKCAAARLHARITVGSVVGWKRRESSSAACRRAVPSRGTAGSGNVHPGSLARWARHGFRSRAIRPLDPILAASHTEDEDRPRGNLRARTSMGDCAKPALRRKKVHCRSSRFGADSAPENGTLLGVESALAVKSRFPAKHRYFAPIQYRFPLPRMNKAPPVNAGVVTDSSPSFASATEMNALDARKTCIVPPLSIA